MVGDLHGQRRELESLLEHVQFDVTTDRLFAVGDLIDRGSDSLGTLGLIEAPWFHTVLGNHEFDLLRRVGVLDVAKPERRALGPAGDWVDALGSKARRRLMDLAERLVLRPLILLVADDSPFFVLHGDFDPLGPALRGALGPSTVPLSAAVRCASSRARLARARFQAAPLSFCGHTVQLSTTPWARTTLTYAGHSPVPCISVHDSQVYLEQRAASRKSPSATLALVEHRAFSRWLEGALAARGQGHEAPALRQAA